MLMDVTRVDAFLSNVQDIPSLPVSVSRVLEMVESADCSATDVACVLMTDPVISAKILKLANSSYYGFRQKIGSIRQAIALLGFATLKNTLLSASVFEMYKTRVPGLDLEGLWLHSFGTAVASKVVSKRVRFPHPEKAFAAGLMHDIGKVVIARYMPESLDAIADSLASKGLSLADAESVTLGFSHADVGAWLLQKWNLPVAITEAVGLHHHPTESQLNFDICGVVYLANILVHRAQIGFSGDSVIREIDPVVPSYFGLSDADLDELQAALHEQREVVEMFTSNTAPGR